MKYTKPPLTFEQQADQLLGRGMTGDCGASEWRETRAALPNMLCFYAIKLDICGE